MLQTERIIQHYLIKKTQNYFIYLIYMCTKHSYSRKRIHFLHCLPSTAGAGRGAGDGWPSVRPSCWGPGWGNAAPRPSGWAAPRAATGTPAPVRRGAPPVRRSCYRSENVNVLSSSVSQDCWLAHLCWRGPELGRGHPRDALHAEAAGPGAAIAALTVGLAPPEMTKGVNYLDGVERGMGENCKH